MHRVASNERRMARVMAGIVGALLVASLAAACATPTRAPSDTGVPLRSAAAEPADRLQAQAQGALERWAEAVRENGGASIVFEGPLTSQIGTWEEDVAENNKSALDAGMVETSTALSEARPGRREVKWVDGTRIEVDVFSAQQALDELVGAANADCEGCEPLHVTEANLATGLVETSEGPAEVPMWVYSLRDTGVRITRVAVDAGVSVDPPPWDAEDPPLGVSIQTAVGEAGSKELEVQFVGTDERCGVEHDVEAVESELAVVVIIEARQGPDGAQPCPPGAGLITVTVKLDAKLGERAVLEIRQGLPVPVHAP
jgi:hypothetical protein